MRIERGLHGPLPFAAVGTGRPLVVLAGLTPVAGVRRTVSVHTLLSGLTSLSASRRLVLFNRRQRLLDGMSMGDFADEHAAALRSAFDEPVDVLGISTGGSIAQQLAADHGDTVRRLVLVSSACRLGGVGKSTQAQVARHLRDGRRDRAVRAAVATFVPRWCGPMVSVVAGLASPLLIPTERDADDLAVTIEAEDAFDLARCPAIAAPTLILAGARDHLYPASLFRETEALIPHSHLQIVPRRGHASVLAGRHGIDRVTNFLERTL